MALVTDPYVFTNGTPADALQVNARIAAIIAQVNGNLDSANLAAGGVTKAKLATDALNNFLKLAAAADRKVAFGVVAAPNTFSNTDQISQTIAHGLGTTPAFVFVMNGHLAAVNTSTGRELPVTNSVRSVDATNIIVLSMLPDGATSPVGSDSYWWMAIA